MKIIKNTKSLSYAFLRNITLESNLDANHTFSHDRKLPF